MDLQGIKDRIKAARTFDHVCGSIVFTCCLPSDSEVSRIFAKHDSIDAMGALLAESVIGMRGATTADLRLDGDAVALPSTQDAIELLLDERNDIAIALAQVIAERHGNRRKAIEGDEKN